ncbi:hypothetical protein BN1708_008752 [Verticillium longisporum]|uniref:non-specific serine/threonine protein kinase n=2 Tax=Verticillium longisporum TaxID=100787 RepID=A0A0G4N7N7_VERLO|nr:hypothetical protein BN1708_008752 [Verticillium longisporum]
MNPGVEVPVLFYPQDVKVRAMEKAATAKAHFETYYSDLLQDGPCVKNYSTLKNLGKGSFGVVRLVRENGDGDLQSGQRRQKNVYAMKVIRKTDMIRSSQEGHLRAERDFLIASETSEWIVQLVSSFQDATNLYLVMEYMPGGDFLGLLIRENILEEHVARHYVAEMVVCVEEAHRLGFIHRDVKPDNFLIDAHGHLKISDFGLAFDGRWQHDTAYYLWQRDDLMRNLGIAVEGDATDQKEDTKTKTDMIRSSQEGHLRAERDFLIASETSEWIVQLVSSFQDATNLYLVMEYMPGGDFLGLLIRENILEEHVARHYVAEMVVCVEEAHRLGFIHRDVKPDNFLIDAHGHLKISDFGLAFDGRWQHDTAYYLWQRDDLMRNLGIAVEGDATDQKEDTKTSKAHKRHQDRVERERHKPPSCFRANAEGDEQIPLVGSLLDWRATRNRTYAKSVVGTSHIGIILYECLYGCTPFLAEGGRHDTKKKILAHDASTFEFPRDIPGVSYECQHLILQLLQNQECRLSSPKYRSQDPLAPQHYVFAEDDAIDIKNHPWFQYLDWNHLHRMTPGFVPHLHASDDTRYFDEDEPVSDWSETAESEGPIISPHKMKRLLRREGFCSRSIGSFMGYIATPFDTTRLRQIDQRIEGKAHFSEEDKHVLKYLVRKFGCKERKGARDILLRDPTTRRDVMNVRKQKAFVDYTWKRAPEPPCVPVAAVDDDGMCYHEEMTETYQQERHAYEAYAAQGTYWELDGQYEIGGGPYAMVNTMYWQGQQQYEQRLDRPYFWDGQYR